ncbi:gliding motility-associated peptidyl-prolyl isomerase GldI [Flavobacterium difficile]|uniref:Peptidyl-prolyl cis-trans isomerase n=1 Tax=Flavobacterium difficile TaxID=2709659 RepID=A0ABX0I1X6_9FLAO|nr:gliding motility-associated peptidyl-prolyl isomerase GldI [Flavobacterium difficile]NHM01185.1 gliding motility-associated peptidyl-prolyl isomerase GldI [Flavobacterium difficile]
MKIFKHLVLIAIATFLTSCSEKQARKPISHSSGSFMKESIDRNKKLNAEEKVAITKIIQKDTSHIYNISEKGFWYAYQTKSTENVFPKKGDVVTFDYEVTDLYGNSIYTLEELKRQTYYVDKQNIMNGLRNGIKLMHQGDKVKFIFPSQSAYGYHGDDNKIGTNQPIICIVTLKEIKSETTE